MLPIWVSHYSLGKSILTLDKPEDEMENGPHSIFKICQEHGIKDLILMENNMSGVMQALKTSKKCELNLFFGLKLIACKNMADRTPESLSTEHKIVIFAKNDAGFKRLIKVYSTAAVEGFYYQPRIDYPALRKLWEEKELFLAHPYYNSFLFRNFLYFSNCIPEPDLIGQNFFVESNSLPFNYLIDRTIEGWAKDHPVNRIKVKTIYYKDKSDFKAYITNRAIHNRATLNAPRVDHLASGDFCFESWLNERD